MVYIIRPILRGRDIKRNEYKFADLYLIFSYFGSHKIIPTKYSAVYQHLKKYEKKLRNRGQCRYRSNGKPSTNSKYPGQHHWLELDNNPCREYMEDFNKQVICWQRITHRPTFCTTKKGMIVLDSMAFLSNFGENTKYLLSVLNSDLFSYWVDRNVHQYGENGYRLSNQYVKIFRIPKKKGKDRELSNQEIYELYELTADEINFVSSFVNP